MMQFPRQRNIWKKRIKNGAKNSNKREKQKKKENWINKRIMHPPPKNMTKSRKRNNWIKKIISLKKKNPPKQCS